MEPKIKILVHTATDETTGETRTFEQSFWVLGNIVRHCYNGNPVLDHKYVVSDVNQFMHQRKMQMVAQANHWMKGRIEGRKVDAALAQFDSVLMPLFADRGYKDILGIRILRHACEEQDALNVLELLAKATYDGTGGDQQFCEAMNTAIAYGKETCREDFYTEYTAEPFKDDFYMAHLVNVAEGVREYLESIKWWDKLQEDNRHTA